MLADRRFNLEEKFKKRGAILKVPAYTKGRKQLSKSKVITSTKISFVRILIDRLIKQIKRFHILKTPVPITFMQYIDYVIICAVLKQPKVCF